MKDKKQGGESVIRVLLEYSNSIIATLREPFLVLDKTLHVVSTNHAFYTLFRVTEEETIGCPLPGLGRGQWDIPKLLQLLREIIPDKIVVKDYEVENTYDHIGHRILLLNATQLRVPKRVAAKITAGVKGEGEAEGEGEGEAEGEEELVLLAIEDITERKRLQEELEESEERYRRAFETSRDGLLLVHKAKADILNSNAAIQALLGYSQRELSKLKLWDIGVTKDARDFAEMLLRLEKDGVIHFEDVAVRAKKGAAIDAEVFLVDKAKVLQCNIRDNTEGKRAQEENKDRIEDLERFSKFAVDRELKMEELEKREKELEEKLKSK